MQLPVIMDNQYQYLQIGNVKVRYDFVREAKLCKHEDGYAYAVSLIAPTDKGDDHEFILPIKPLYSEGLNNHCYMGAVGNGNNTGFSGELVLTTYNNCGISGSEPNINIDPDLLKNNPELKRSFGK